MSLFRRHKILFIVMVVVVVIVLLLTVGAGSLIYNFMINRASPIHMSRIANPTNDDVMLRSGAGGTTEDWEWFETGERISILTEDDVELVAQYLPNDPSSHRYVITCHGTGSRRIHMASYARQFHNMGFHVLAPDARAHGESGGDLIGMGWLERLDVLAWAQELIARDPDAEIILHGVSLGGATVLMTAGEPLPSNIKAAISDSGFTTAYEQFMNYTPWFMVPGMKTASWINKMKVGRSFQEISPAEQIQHSQIPLLFIHGDKDSVVPVSMVDELYAAASCEKEKLVVSGADHTFSYMTDSDLYWDTVKNFAEKYLQPSAAE